MNLYSQTTSENVIMGRTEKLFEQPSALSNELDWSSPVPEENSTTRLIPLTRGKFAIVDACDFEHLTHWKWYAQKIKDRYYAARHAYRRGPVVLMHRQILDAPKGMEVDHRDNDGLRNVRSNLRLATHTQNNCNKGPQSNSTSGIKGVSWDAGTGKWRATIKGDGRSIYLGIYPTKEQAGEAYAAAAIRYQGEFANVGVRV